MSKFKVGDRVEIVDAGASSFFGRGDTGTIAHFDGCGDPWVDFDESNHHPRTADRIGGRWCVAEEKLRRVPSAYTLSAKESDRKEVAKYIREIQECFNEAIKECQVVGIDVSLSVEGLELKVDMTHTPDKRIY